jgi:hypothetical protein
VLTPGREADGLVDQRPTVVSDRAGHFWSAPAALNDNAASDADAVGGLSGASDREPSIATDGAGRWIVLWNSPTGIRSRHRPRRRVATVVNTATAGAGTGIDAAPQTTTDGAGRWVAVWFSDDPLDGTNLHDDRDVLTASAGP